MYAAISKLVPDAAFAVFTGDIVDHAVWNTTQSQNTIDIQSAYGRMKGLGVPVYGVVGNHETSPTNAFEPSAVGAQSQWVYNVIADAWSPWVGSPGQSGESFGAYSVAAGTNLRIISLNTNLWYAQNYYLYTEPMEQDPSGQISWLVSELDAAEKAGQRVYIIGHMPNGISDALHDPSNYFDQVVNRYSNTIAAMFYGHTHWDHFQVSYNNYAAQAYGTASAMTYICPSLTPTSGMPAFRVYTVDPDTFAVLDAETYLADMTNSEFQTSGPVWTRSYSAKEVYGTLVSPPLTDPNAELSPAFWHNVTVAFSADSDDFEAYWSRKTRGWNVPACDSACQTSEICTIRAGRSENNCFTPTPGINFRKRDLHDDHHPGQSECGYSAFGEALVELSQNQGMLSMLELKAKLAKV
jgi:sphingomyelin phosphodiesterase